MMQQPPYPPITRAGGFRFELDCERIAQSDTWALADARQRPLLLMLWFIAWQQTPCGSLPGEDAIIAARLGLSLAEFQPIKPILLRGWSQASDGRLYHPVLTELVLDMIGRKTRETQRKAAYRQKQREARDAELSRGTHAGQSGDGQGNDTEATRESGGSDDTTTTTTTIKKKPIPDGMGGHQAEPDAPACPHQEILALYAKHLPGLPQPRVWDGQRVSSLKARWRWVLTAKKPNGGRYATDTAGGLDFFDRFFGYVAESDFLMGRDGKWSGCNLAWLVKAENFAKVLEGQYENRSAA